MMNKQKPRFEARFRNGRWNVFDYRVYRGITAHSLGRDAQRQADILNMREEGQR